MRTGVVCEPTGDLGGVAEPGHLNGARKPFNPQPVAAMLAGASAVAKLTGRTAPPVIAPCAQVFAPIYGFDKRR